MGKCTLTFDPIQIINQRSDTGHADNDWLIVTWFVGPKNVRTDTVPLRASSDGNVVLHTGNTILPISLDVACGDNDLVSASFVAFNLSSTGFSEQVKAAGDIAKTVSKKIAEIYLKAAELYVQSNPEIPLNQVWAKAINKMAPIIVDSVGAAWDDVILPVVNEVIQFLQALFGHPNCNGEIFHDIVLFDPFAPTAAETWFRSYSAHSPDACGHDPRTSVMYTRERTRDSIPHFPPTPAPKVEITESQGESPKTWFASWAESATVPTPRFIVIIEPTRVASDVPSVSTLMAVTIREVVDPRFDVRFEAGDDPVSPQAATLPYYKGDVLGEIKPWFHSSARPVGLVLDFPAATPGLAAAPGDQMLQTPQPLLIPRLAWEFQRSTAAGLALTSTMGSDLLGGVGEPKSLAVSVEAIVLPAVGVHLSLYVLKIERDPNKHFMIRYTRAENDLYTKTDVMLWPWNAPH
jgi:hypothetical protein